MIKFRLVDHDPDVNVRREPPAREFLRLLGGFLIILAVIYAALGFTVDMVVDRMTPEFEARIWKNLVSEEGGKSWRQAAEDTPDLVAHQQRIDRLFQSLPEDFMRRIPPFAYEIRVLKEDTANAMALPGGRILIHSGLMDAVESDGGLLFVIGHELGHIAGKDHLRSMG